MGSHSTPEKNLLQRKPVQEEAQLAKSAHPPSFELDASAAQMKVAQLQEAPGAETPKKEAEVQAEVAKEETPAAPKSEADQLRDAVAGEAATWVDKEFISETEIARIAKANNMPNYTTCFEFAGKMMGDSAKKVYGKDFKKTQATSKEFVQTKGDWEKAIMARATAKGFGMSVKLFTDAIVRVQKDLDKAIKEVADLRVPKEGVNPMINTQRAKQADILEKLRVGALLRVIATLERQRDKWQGKIDENNAKAEQIDANNTAMIKAEDGMTNGRPKKGEYVILAQAKTAKYGKAGTQVDLISGSFKHIAVFIEAKAAEEGYEIWKTIDGGGTDGKVTELRVRLSDRMIFPAASKNFADVGSASGTKLAGWMDMAEIIRKRDEKMAAGKK